jgi:hypothetical protein
MINISHTTNRHCYAHCRDTACRVRAVQVFSISLRNSVEAISESISTRNFYRAHLSGKALNSTSERSEVSYRCLHYGRHDKHGATREELHIMPQRRRCCSLSKNIRNRAESIKKSHIPHDCEHFHLNNVSDKMIFKSSTGVLLTSISRTKSPLLQHFECDHYIHSF